MIPPGPEPRTESLSSSSAQVLQDRKAARWPGLRKPFRTRRKRQSVGEMLAGALGFEPRYVGTKNRCLTTWRRPNRAGVFSEAGGGVQGAIREIFAPLTCLAGVGAGG